MAVPPSVANARCIVPVPSCLRDVHGIPRHVGDDSAVALIRRLARRVNLHDEMPDAAVGAELDLGVPHAHARKPVDLIACLRVAAARDALDGEGVVAEARDEPVAFSGPGGAAGEEQQRGWQRSASSDGGRGSRSDQAWCRPATIRVENDIVRETMRPSVCAARRSAFALCESCERIGCPDGHGVPGARLPARLMRALGLPPSAMHRCLAGGHALDPRPQ